MSGLHVFTGRNQPATLYDIADAIGEPYWIENHPRRQMWCHRCERKRWASRLLVQVHYDTTYVFCADKDHCFKTRKRRQR